MIMTMMKTSAAMMKMGGEGEAEEREKWRRLEMENRE
jgi:hypothetical protein